MQENGCHLVEANIRGKIFTQRGSQRLLYAIGGGWEPPLQGPWQAPVLTAFISFLGQGLLLLGLFSVTSECLSPTHTAHG